jgi:hypothetical protein
MRPEAPPARVDASKRGVKKAGVDRRYTNLCHGGWSRQVM